jgi:hypothetical protein
MIRAHQRSKAFTAARGLKRVMGGFYGKKTLLRILGQPNCVGIRYYLARNARGQQTLVLVGEDKEGKLLLRLMIDEGPICPPICDKSGALGL